MWVMSFFVIRKQRPWLSEISSSTCNGQMWSLIAMQGGAVQWPHRSFHHNREGLLGMPAR